MEQNNKEFSLSGHNDILTSNLRRSFSLNECRIAFVEDNKCVFFFKYDENTMQKQELDSIIKKIDNYSKRLELDLEKARLSFGMSDIPGYIHEVHRNYDRCLKALKIGPHLYPDSKLWSYSQLGVLAWMDIKDDELNIMMREIKCLFGNDENKELIETLKVYIDCKMNYSLTAEKLFIHINTVRKRIEKITDLINIDLNDAISRLKVELLLKII